MTVQDGVCLYLPAGEAPAFEKSTLDFALGGERELIDQRLDRALHHFRQIVEGRADAVVGDAVLGEVVGPNLLGALAGADLRPANLARLLLRAQALSLVEAGAQDGHRPGLVLELRTL